MMKRVRVVVSGRVQAVGFRWACREEARRRGLAGFVRNLPGGRVEAAFEGEDEDVDALVEWCRNGPSWASVTSLEATAEPVTGERRFAIVD
jgi:acylphosphatase